MQSDGNFKNLNRTMDIIIRENIGNNISLQLISISINQDYCEKWNIREKDYVCLTKNGKLLRPTLYRVGGINNPNLEKDNYFMLLKHVEAFYDDSITKIQKDKPHLEGRWCIIDKNGIEKVEFPQFKFPYPITDSCIYSIENKYYNIETGEFYCESYSSMVSTDYLFLENKYDKDKSKQGVMKINKKDGTWELFP